MPPFHPSLSSASSSAFLHHCHSGSLFLSEASLSFSQFSLSLSFLSYFLLHLFVCLISSFLSLSPFSFIFSALFLFLFS